MAQKVSSKLAADCVERYQKLFQSKDIATINKAYSSSVSFPVASIKAVIQAMADTDNVEIQLGIYTKEFVTQYPVAKEGRLTAFIYPKPATITTMDAALASTSTPIGGPTDGDPYNLGDILP